MAAAVIAVKMAVPAMAGARVGCSRAAVARVFPGGGSLPETMQLLRISAVGGCPFIG